MSDVGTFCEFMCAAAEEKTAGFNLWDEGLSLACVKDNAEKKKQTSIKYNEREEGCFFFAKKRNCDGTRDQNYTGEKNQ